MSLELERKMLEICNPLGKFNPSSKKKEFLSLLGELPQSPQTELLFLSCSLIALSQGVLQKLNQGESRQMARFKVAICYARLEACLALASRLSEDTGNALGIEGLWIQAVELSKEAGGLMFELQSRANSEICGMATEVAKARQLILEEYSKIGDGIPPSKKIAQSLGL